MTERHYCACHYCASCHHIQDHRARYCDQCAAALNPPGARLTVRFGPVVTAQRRIPETIAGMVDRYVLLEHLGSGGMGMVYRAMDPRSGQHFAVKVLGREFRVQRQALSLLVQEAATQAAIVHPNVVQLFEFIQTPRDTALVMELVEGVSLAGKLDQRGSRQLSQGQFLWLGLQMAQGLSVVHDHGYVHADVKPANFLFGRSHAGDTVLKVADFGIARRLEAQKRVVAGTYGYMSPEQMLGEPLTPASDIYGLGCVYYEVLSGKPVFPVQDAERLAWLHCNESPPPLDAKEAAPPLAALVQAMLSKDPASRPRSSAAVSHSLQGMIS